MVDINDRIAFKCCGPIHVLNTNLSLPCTFALHNMLPFDRPWTSAGVSLILLGLVLAARAAFVFPLSFISNLTRKSQSDRIGFKQQVAIFSLN